MAENYKDTNLNEFLQPINSPITTGGAVSSYAFDSRNERNAVGNFNIKDLTADKITAGTIDATIITIDNIPPENITSGTLNSQINLGTVATGYIRIDGVNNRIVNNDGTVDRIYFGNLS